MDARKTAQRIVEVPVILVGFSLPSFAQTAHIDIDQSGLQTCAEPVTPGGGMADRAVRIFDVFAAQDCSLALVFTLAEVPCLQVLLQRQARLIAPAAVS